LLSETGEQMKYRPQINGTLYDRGRKRLLTNHIWKWVINFYLDLAAMKSLPC